MLSRYFIDFHIHTALSPCADNQMTPKRIIEAAVSHELHIIAITDHNSAENVPALLKAAEHQPVTVIPGMEVQTREEVHLVCLFPGVKEIMVWQHFVYERLPDRKNREDYFGEQWVFDENGKPLQKCDRLLIASTSLGLEETVEKCQEYGGICYPAHVDRSNNSIISNLGFIPEEPVFPAVEISPMIKSEDALKRFPYLEKYTLIGSSDAHQLEEILWARSEIHIENPVFSEIALALEGEKQRKAVTI